MEGWLTVFQQSGRYARGRISHNYPSKVTRDGWKEACGPSWK